MGIEGRNRDDKPLAPLLSVPTLPGTLCRRWASVQGTVIAAQAPRTRSRGNKQGTGHGESAVSRKHQRGCEHLPLR